MMAQRRARKPNFFWQGGLILLPVVLLAAVGFFSLRQDQRLTRQEASLRAQGIAEELVQRIWNDLTEAEGAAQLQPHTFEVDAAGQLVFPPPPAALPVPSPLDLDHLSLEQARLWCLAQAAESGAHNPASAVRAWRDFAESDPPADFAGPAEYALGLQLAKAGDAHAAAERFALVVDKCPSAVGESGLPLEPLAQLKLIELAASSNGVAGPEQLAQVEALCSNAVYRPTLLTPHLLGVLLARASASQTREEIQKWQRIWEAHEETRELFDAASAHFQLPLAAPLSLPSKTNDVLFAGIGAPGSTGLPRAAVPRVFWFGTPGVSRFLVNPGAAAPMGGVVFDYTWVALPVVEAGSNQWFHCRTESQLGLGITPLVAAAGRMPDYFGVGIEIGGRKLTRFAPDLRLWHVLYYSSKGAGQEKKEYLDQAATEVLASATPAGAGAAALKVSIYLTSPSALFEAQRARTFWFGLLIAAATLAALVGLLAAYRSFRRQLRLSEMKSNFVSSVSHELRAPIASVRLMAESLERGKIAETPKQREYFRFIGQECRRLSSLIENVLDFSRIEQGRTQYEFEPTDLIALTRETVRLMQTYAEERQITLALTLPDAPSAAPSLQPAVDGKAVQQALINLIDNAIKHSPKGATVTVGLEVGSAECGVRSARAAGEAPQEPKSDLAHNASVITLWVEDHGEGIAPAEHEKIFERFYRVGSELRRETQGVGIGLSIVKHVVEAHGGKVRVRSAVGQGSCFTIELPMSNNEETKGQSPEE